MARTSDPPVGIDDLNIYGSTLTVDYGSIVAARGGRQKNLHDTRFACRSVLPPFEDPITLAVNAAKPIVDSAGPAEFGLLIVATETGLDYGKPLSTYAHKYLGLEPYCTNFEIKHACYAGTAALHTAAAWVATSSAGQQGSRALVITTDIARRQLGKLVELTAGAGAVAFSVTAHPRILELEHHRGCAAREAFDVARPTMTTEWDDALLSLGTYLDLLEGAWDRYRQLTSATSLAGTFSYMLYHTPLVSLAERAHRTLLEGEDWSVSAEDVAASFERMTQPSLGYNLQLGNVYSGSLYASLAGLVDFAPTLEPGTRVGFYSYGSGACAEVFGGRVGLEARPTVSRHHICRRLARRRPVSVAEYDAAMREVERGMISSNYEPERPLVLRHFEEAYQGQGLLVLDRVANHYRRYCWS